MFDSRTDAAHSQNGIRICTRCGDIARPTGCECFDTLRRPRATAERMALAVELADADFAQPAKDDRSTLRSVGFTGTYTVAATIDKDAPAARVPGSSAGRLPIVGLGAKKRRAGWSPRLTDGRKHPVTVTHI